MCRLHPPCGLRAGSVSEEPPVLGTPHPGCCAWGGTHSPGASPVWLLAQQTPFSFAVSGAERAPAGPAPAHGGARDRPRVAGGTAFSLQFARKGQVAAASDAATRRPADGTASSSARLFTSGRWLSAEAPAAAGPLTPALLQEAAVSALGALCSESCAQAPGQAGPAGLGEWPRPRAGACACGSRHGHPCAQSTASRGRPGHPVPASWQAAWCGSASQSSGARRRPRAAASRWPWAPFPPPC